VGALSLKCHSLEIEHVFICLMNESSCVLLAGELDLARSVDLARSYGTKYQELRRTVVVLEQLHELLRSHHISLSNR
jgi:hypothetical protein